MPKLGDLSDEDRRRGVAVQAVTAIVSYRDVGKELRTSKSVDIQIKLEPGRLRRHIDSRLDLLMGKTPKGLECTYT